MQVKIADIIVSDRIREDLGNISELAEDIKANGLINPIAVNTDMKLLAGHRRLEAVKLLGWETVPATIMETINEEHELAIEVSENEARKEFSRSERARYMAKVLEAEKAKAKERMSEGGKGCPNSDTLKRADEATAKDFGIGKDTLRKELSIVEHQSLLEPEDFADWDEGRLSTNKAYQKLKAKLAEAEAETQRTKLELSDERIKNIKTKKALEELKEKESEPRIVERVPDDYEDLKAKAKKAEAYRQDYQNEQARYTEQQKKVLALQDEIEELKRATTEGLDRKSLSENVVYFCTVCNNFIGNVGGLVWLTDRIADMSEHERDIYLKAAYSFKDWALAFSQNLERIKDEEKRISTTE